MYYLHKILHLNKSSLTRWNRFRILTFVSFQSPAQHRWALGFMLAVGSGGVGEGVASVLVRGGSVHIRRPIRRSTHYART